MACGKIYYKLGYEPFHVLNFLRNRQLRDMLLVTIGYFTALIKRDTKFDIANFVWRYQMRRLL
jgi:hypothetical protein